LAAAAAGVEDQDLTGAVRQLDTGDWSARMRTVHELEYMEDAGLPALVVASEDGDWQVRMAAVHALGPLGPKATPILKSILRYEPCPVVRLMALHNLGSLAADGAEEAALDWMFSASGAQVNDCRDQPAPGRAAWAVRPGRRAPDAPAAALPVRRRAAAKPVAVPPDEPPESNEVVVTPDVPAAAAASVAVPAPAVTKAELPSAAPEKRRRDAELDSLLAGPSGSRETSGETPAAFAAPARALDSTELSRRRTGAPESFPKPVAAPLVPDHAGGGPAAFEAAGSKAPHDALPDLILALRSRDVKTRARAADELGYSGGAASAAVPALVAALKDKNPRVRASASLALGNIGADDRAVVPLLVKALKDKNLDVRYAAALALSRIGTPAASAALRSRSR